MIRLPLTVDTKKEAKDVRSAILHHLGDSIYDRYPEKYDDLDVPEPLASSKALGTPPKSKRSTFGSIISFKDEIPFGMLFFHYDPEDGISYSVGSHAGWHKAGTEEDIREYYKAFDAVLEELGVLADSYRFTCPCGDEEVINGGYVDVSEYISKHNEEGHSERRISTSTLVGREVTINSPAQSESSQRQQANS